MPRYSNKRRQGHYLTNRPCTNTQSANTFPTLQNTLGDITTACEAQDRLKCEAQPTLEQVKTDYEITNDCYNGICPEDDELNHASQCAGGAKEESYGARVRVTLVNDASCADSRYHYMCKTEMSKGRMVECPEQR